MKKRSSMKNDFLGMLALGILLLNACENPVSDSASDSAPPDTPVVARIKDLKNDDILGKMEALQMDSSEDLFADVDMDKVHLFLDSPGIALEQIAGEENGEAQLAVIEALLNEGTVDDVLQALEKLAPETALELESALDELAEAMQISNEEVSQNLSVTGVNASRTNGAKPNIRQLPLRLSDKRSVQTTPSPLMRSVFSEDLDWPSVAVYSGLCVTTVIALYTAESYLPWVKVASYITAEASGSLLLYQMYRWKDSGLWKFFVGLKDHDYEGVTNFINSSEEAEQILTISAVTAATAVACQRSPLGQHLTSILVSTWEWVLARIAEILPDCRVKIRSWVKNVVHQTTR
jgi:DNA-directed RNA polymerase subunit F